MANYNHLIKMKTLTKIIVRILCLTLLMNQTIQAQDDLNVLGSWIVDSTHATVTVPLSQEDLDQLMLMVDLGFLSAEDFLEEMGFEMPTTPEEWYAIATNGITYSIPDDELDISAFSFTENQMGLFAQGWIPLNYTWSSDSIITIEPIADFPFTEFTIVSATSDNLIMSSSATITDEDDEFNYNIIFYCSSAEEFTLGCTDPSALNYNTDANIDDDSCEYPYPCTSNELLLTLEDEESDGWEGSELIINGTSYTLEDGDEETFCIEMSDCWGFYTIEGDYMDEASWTISDDNDEIIAEGGLPYNNNDVDEDGECDDLKIEELSIQTNSLIKVIDVLGREQKEFKTGEVLFYIYENGYVEKKVKL